MKPAKTKPMRNGIREDLTMYARNKKVGKGKMKPGVLEEYGIGKRAVMMKKLKDE